MSRMSEIDTENADLETYQTDAYFADLGVKYVGKQDRPGDFPLDMFNDLVTKSTFVRGPMESVLDLAKRIRKGHTATGGVAHTGDANNRVWGK